MKKTLLIISANIKWFVLVSAIIIIPGLFSLARWGLRASIDFTGGTLLELRVDEKKHDVYQVDALRKVAGDSVQLVSAQWTGNNQVLLRFSPMTMEKKTEFMGKVQKNDASVKETRFEMLGPVLGKELIVKTGYAILLSIVCITLYLAVRFSSLQYGVSAAIATLHDALVVLGSFSLLGHFFGVEVDVLFVTALLTILSFSVHDTIIVFDRIRERTANKTNKPFEDIVNEAALETLSRSIRNSLAVLFMLLMVFLLTSGSLHWFIATLLIGTLTGTYSSTCVALPLLILWERRKKKQGK